MREATSIIRAHVQELALLSLLAIGTCLFPAVAAAADSIYWTAGLGSKVAFANLDGSGGENLATGNATVAGPVGTALDPANGRIYWVNPASNRISFANLDGSGGADFLATGTATVSLPVGIAIDPAARRIYWANGAANKISFANLDGKKGESGDLNTGAATVNGPEGVAIDPASGRIYWANFGANKISFANLDGTGGGDLNTGAAPIVSPEGVAIDPPLGRIFWSNTQGDSIGFANVDGSGGGGALATNVAVSSPTGLAIDPAAGRIYWANRNRGGSILSTNIDGSGAGATINTGNANVEATTFPSLLLAPLAQAAPEISGAAITGSVLSCSPGTWAPDLIASFLYRAPQSFAYQWSLDGADIPGAMQSTVSATSAGDYRCRVTATNHAGSSTQASAVHHVSLAPPPPHPGPIPRPILPAFGADAKVTLSLVGGRAPARGPIRVRVANANDFPITGVLSAQSIAKIGKRHRHPVKLHGRNLSLGAGAEATVKLVLPRPLRLLFAHRHRLSLHLTATVADPAANHRTVEKTVAAKLRAA